MSTVDPVRYAKGTVVAYTWQVSHNSRYGQPGPLAYKVDTHVVNRRIDKASREPEQPAGRNRASWLGIPQVRSFAAWAGRQTIIR